MPLCSLLPSGSAVELVTHVLIHKTHVRFATVASNDNALVCSHTHTLMMGNTPTTSQILEPIHVSLHVRVVGDQGAIHVLIRVRHRSQSSPRVFPQSVCFTQQRGSSPNRSRPRASDSLTSSSSRDFSASCTIRSNFGLIQFPFLPRYSD